MFFTLPNPIDRYLLCEEGADPDTGTGGGGGGPTVDVEKIKRQGIEEGRRKAARDIAEQLGCTVDEAKALIEAKRTEDNEKKSEADKALEAAQAAKADADRARQEAAADRLAARIERKLTAEGVDPKALARATRLITVEPDADDDAITAEIDTLKADVPGLFTSTGDGTPPPPGVKPPKPKRSGGETPAEAARRRFEETQTPLAATA